MKASDTVAMRGRPQRDPARASVWPALSVQGAPRTAQSVGVTALDEADVLRRRAVSHGAEIVQLPVDVDFHAPGVGAVAERAGVVAALLLRRHNGDVLHGAAVAV
jgi:hypothetical protein